MTDNTYSKQPIRLMIIDDEKRITDLIERGVRKSEVTFLSVNDPKLISRALAKFDPEIIFLDLCMEGYHGAGIIHYIASLDCNAKIYLISSLDRAEVDACQAEGVKMDLNIIGALTKPFTQEDLDHALNS
jgi:two-component SAPR family response regulator